MEPRINDGLRQDREALQHDWEKVGNDFLTALQEVSQDIGGDDLSEQVISVATAGKSSTFDIADILLLEKGLVVLENASPGAGTRALDRMEEIQEARHKAEREELENALAQARKTRIKRFGKALIDANALIWGSPYYALTGKRWKE